jgi:hypothetical protein
VAEPSGHPEQINIFPLAEPEEWFVERDQILKTLVSAINPDLPGFLKPEYDFSIDPVSGWVRFSLANDLWNAKPKRSLPPDASVATKAAQEFIERLKVGCRQEEYLKLKIPPLLPAGPLARIAHVVTTPVLHSNEPWTDHWLCRFEVYLKSFDNSSAEAPVFGSGIDIRIGQKSKVVGFVSHWRPALLEKAQLAQLFQLKEEEHSHSNDERPTPRLVYELNGENCPQAFITPYYLSLEGHHGGMFPASPFSLLVEMAFSEKTKGGAMVVPRIVGGSGDYTFSWAYWRPDALFDEGLVGRGEREFIELLPGIYSVMLHVRDNRTGVVQLHEKMAFVKGDPGEESVLSA